MLICKFGGTSVGSPQALSLLIDIMGDERHRTKSAAVVVSALSGVTDSLIELAQNAVDIETSTNTDTRLHNLEKRRRDLDAAFQRHRNLAAAFLQGEPLKQLDLMLAKLFLDLRRILGSISTLHELSKRTMDMVMSFGERFSALVVAGVLRETGKGRPVEMLDARTLIKTDDNYGNARFIAKATFANIQKHFHEKDAGPNLAVITGFIGSTMDGVTTTIGRGGSDLTAAIFGAALDAQAVEIWTDVDGILTADPRLVDDAFLIERISYIEAMELSHFGAKVLFPPTIKPSLEKGIPIWIRNTFNPDGHGTLITREPSPGDTPVLGISLLDQVALVRIQGSGMVGVAGFSSRLFGALARQHINIILITQSSSEYSICFAIMPHDMAAAETAIDEEFAGEIESGLIEEPVAEGEFAIIAVVGSKMKSSPGISGKFFHALGKNSVNITAIAQGSSELNISAVVSREDTEKAVNAVHEAFFLSTTRTVNLFLVGIGLIGGTLLEQIAANQQMLAKQHHIRVNLIGAANSHYMTFKREGLAPRSVKDLLKNTGSEPVQGPGTADFALERFDIDAYIKTLKKMNLPNTAFCDCTASPVIAERYLELLNSAIPVITPNKRANSGSFEYYQALTTAARERGTPYLYEVTVCAGLPVISTLRDLFLSGDKVRRIEAVLSGTLSFIFNSFDGSKSFSELVREAKAKGYTEPDPRDDLNAMDAARKALILARECGIALEFNQVAIEPILPPACFEAKTVDSFFEELQKHDGDFESRRKEAAEEGKALCYVAIIEDGSARLSLRSEPPDSPFRSLVDSDNIVVITSDRYSKLPMVIKGPGAGAQVTAGGVFADIVRIARTLV